MRCLPKRLSWHRFTANDEVSSLSLFAYVLVFLLSGCLAAPARGQQTSTRRDTSAIAFLTQVLTAAGGTAALSSVQDFTATGTITHNWDDNPEQGQLTVKARGLTQFRLRRFGAHRRWCQCGHIRRRLLGTELHVGPVR